MSRNIGFVSYKRIGVSALRTMDFALIVIGYLLATGIAAVLSRWQIFRYPSAEEWSELPMTLVPITLISWSAVSSYCRIYASHREEPLPYITVNVLRTILLWAAFSLGAVYLARLKYSSRQFMLEFIVCAGALILARQVVMVLLLRTLRNAGYDHKTALVVGTKVNCERFMGQTNHLCPKGYRFVPLTVTSAGVLHEEDLDRAKAVTADEIFMVGSPLSLESKANPAVRFLTEGKPIHIVPEVIDASLFRQSLGEISGMPVLTISCGRLTWLEKVAKRAVDITCAPILLLLSAPIWIVTAVVVKLTSPGPILFRQTRLGRDGLPFKLLKFRTMCYDAERELMRSPELYRRYLSNNYKIPPGEDPRLTPVGAFLRAVSVDELPQLLNVVKGQMSLVGPRPVLPTELKNYGDFASLFLSAKPGMTGHWQVSGRSEIQEYRERVELDLEYIRDQSIRTDFEILFRTVPTVLRRKGAY
jgi:exopolysaccharide biosynthesis polyprenyl glycosylphosphotransferase